MVEFDDYLPYISCLIKNHTFSHFFPVEFWLNAFCDKRHTPLVFSMMTLSNQMTSSLFVLVAKICFIPIIDRHQITMNLTIDYTKIIGPDIIRRFNHIDQNHPLTKISPSFQQYKRVSNMGFHALMIDFRHSQKTSYQPP